MLIPSGGARRKRQGRGHDDERAEKGMVHGVGIGMGMMGREESH